MATLMLPFEAKLSEEYERRAEQRLRLTLHEYTAPPARTRRRTRPQNVWENLMFVAVLAAMLAFCLVGAVRSLSRAATASDRLPAAATAVLPVTVHSGDTLWTYAQKYGTPDTYILDRVETIARANHLSSDTELVPGQRLLIPVTNPLVLARIEGRQRLARR